jgi:hypothetical protein
VNPVDSCKEAKMTQEKSWSHKNFEVREGLKPGSKYFQYFFLVSEGGKKKCNYCVWIDDENLVNFSPEKEFETIAYSRRGEWRKWVEEKIDQGDFRNLVLKVEKTGSRVIDVTEMEEKLNAE